MRSWVAVGAAVVVCALTGVGSASASASHATVTTVVSGLDNPRDLAFGRDGRLYVAEAGHGGTGGCFTSPELGTQCVGFTGKIARVNVAAGTVRTVARGFVSIAGKDGSFATGVDGISVRGSGRIYGIITGSALGVPSGVLPAKLTAHAKRQLGRLVVASPAGRWARVADVGDRDFVWSSHHQNLVPGQFPDANPYGVLAVRGGAWVVDAASNTLDWVGTNGHVRVVKFIPNPPASDAVPTCIGRSRAGSLFIGELTGGGNAPGASVVWRYNPTSGRLSKWATGLTAVSGCGFGGDGQFYATEFSTLGLDHAAPGTGAVVRVPAHSTAPVVVASGLNFPGGFAARGSSLFVSNWSIAPANTGGGPTGSVVRISLGS
jgi:hypothetical protein